jgi:hypothetical protein
MYMNQQVAFSHSLHFTTLNVDFLSYLEDTFLLLDALEADAQDLRNDNPIVCLEIGYLTSTHTGRTVTISL